MTAVVIQLLFLVAAAITLAEAANPRRFNRNSGEDCSDAFAKGYCDLLPVNGGCHGEEAVNCAKTCRLCHDCEDKNPHYCKLEKEEGVLDCSRDDMIDFCRVTCNKCVVCQPNCVNGLCIGPNICECDEGWTGDICDEAVQSTSEAINRNGGQKLNRVQRDENCSDTWAKEECESIALTGGCDEDDKAVNCAKTCRLCHGVHSTSLAIIRNDGQKLNLVRRDVLGCEDKDPDYCKQEAEEGVLDCSREEMIDICRATCNECGCEDKNPDYCKQEAEEGVLDCSREEMIDICRATCNKCGELTTSEVINRNAGQTLKRVRRACKDISKMCNDYDVCEDDELNDYCLKTCDLCNSRSNIPRRRRGVEDPLMPLKRKRDSRSNIPRRRRGVEDPLMPLKRKREACVDSDSEHCRQVAQDGNCGSEDLALACPKSCGMCKEACVDSDSAHCQQVAQDGNCGSEDLALACPKSCGMCEQARYLLRGIRKSEDELLPQLRTASECKDDVDHCEEIYNRNLCGEMETNHICKLTCGLCNP